MSKLAEEIFRFVSDVDAKRLLLSDLDELHKCMEGQMWKASMVLSGSLIEAVLYHYINNTDTIRTQIQNFDKSNDVALNNLLVWAKQFNVIDENLFRLSEPIRDYRNLVHPRVQERLKVQVSSSLVQIGYNVFLEIVRNINKTYEASVSQEARVIVNQIVNEVRKSPATEADVQVYAPIIEKYGVAIGSKIVERSLNKGIEK